MQTKSAELTLDPVLVEISSKCQTFQDHVTWRSITQFKNNRAIQVFSDMEISTEILKQLPHLEEMICQWLGEIPQLQWIIHHLLLNLLSYELIIRRTCRWGTIYLMYDVWKYTKHSLNSMFSNNQIIIYNHVWKRTNYIWLVVSTILKNISQWEGLSHILWKMINVPNHKPGMF